MTGKVLNIFFMYAAVLVMVMMSLFPHHHLDSGICFMEEKDHVLHHAFCHDDTKNHAEEDHHKDLFCLHDQLLIIPGNLRLAEPASFSFDTGFNINPFPGEWPEASFMSQILSRSRGFEIFYFFGEIQSPFVPGINNLRAPPVS